MHSALTIHPCKCTKATDDGLTVICKNTNLASLSVALANIAVEKTPIDDLLIDRSHFGKKKKKINFQHFLSPWHLTPNQYAFLAILFGPMFLNLMCRKISIRNTPIERIDDYVFYGVNETLQEFEIHNSKLTAFPKAFKVFCNFFW